MTDVVQIFQVAAFAAGYQFAYGRKDILNYETSSASLAIGQTVLMVFPFVETGEISNSIIHRWNVSTQLWLGKKFDTEIVEEETVLSGTYSQLDETEKQKYDRRLKDLRNAMETLLKSIFCNQDLELTSAKIFRELNQFDENLDFVTADITFSYDS